MERQPSRNVCNTRPESSTTTHQVADLKGCWEGNFDTNGSYARHEAAGGDFDSTRLRTSTIAPVVDKRQPGSKQPHSRQLHATRGRDWTANHVEPAARPQLKSASLGERTSLSRHLPTLLNDIVPNPAPTTELSATIADCTSDSEIVLLRRYPTQLRPHLHHR